MGYIKDIAPGLSIGMRSGSVIEVTQSKVEPDAVGTAFQGGGEDWSRWGTNNKYPLEILDQAKQDSVSMGALKFKKDAHYGLGTQLYRKIYDKGKEILTPVDITKIPEIDEFFFENDIDNFCQSIIQDFEWFTRYHVQYIPNKTRNRIVRINSGVDEIGSANFLRTKDIRKKKRNKATGQMEGFYMSGDWTESNPQTAFLPSFNRRDPFGKPNAVFEHKLTSISNDYYPTPEWYSSLKWLAVAAKIPDWINGNIDNSINIKYHIQIPQEYFLQLYPRERYDTETEWYKAVEDAEENIKKAIDDMLAGAKNAGKAFYSKFAVDENGTVMPGWKIEAIENKINDEAWLKADQTASVRILTAHGVDPTLAGIVIGNTSSGSGSDVREKFNYHMQLRTVIPRQTTTEWFEFVKRFNKWDRDLHLGYKNIVLQTLDENKSGYAQQDEPKPTTPEK